mgnify:CR=1 FL=1
MNKKEAEMDMELPFKQSYKTMLHVLTALGFDLTPPVAMRVLLKAVSKDKKSEGDVLNVVFPTAIGACEVVPMPLEEFRAMFA